MWKSLVSIKTYDETAKQYPRPGRVCLTVCPRGIYLAKQQSCIPALKGHVLQGAEGIAGAKRYVEGGEELRG